VNVPDGRSSNDIGVTAERAALLATKLHVPRSRGKVVQRGALLEALSVAPARKLTLVSAPAGWGKTTLLAQWVSGADDEQRLSWLSLDSSDNDPMWFWMYVIAALQKSSPGIGSRAAELLEMGAAIVRVVLPTLLNELDDLPRQMVLVLDDYHLVTCRAIQEQMAFILNRMPANLHLVLATRSDPDLSLARLRAGGDLVEVRSDDLRFESTEASQLLSVVLGLDLDAADIELLCRRTEGWAAGLYLAALSLVGRSDPAASIRSFGGDNRHIVDYLMAEVLDGQPPHVRSFLLRTSVLRRLSGELCDAALQETGSASVLEQIERENLFLMPLDLSRRWYRYHHLFAELLRTELHRSEPALVPTLHQRAAGWFEAEGLIDAAVRHLIAADDVARTAELIAAEWVNEFNRGGLSTVSSWLDLLPGETVLKDPRLSVARSWIALNEGRLDDAAFWVESVEARAAASAGDATIGAQAVVLRAIFSFKVGDIPAALKTAGRATTLDLGEAPLARSGVYCIYGNALYFSGRVDEAQAAYRRAAQRAERIGDRRYRIYALGYLALIAAERGQLTDAERQIRRANGGGTDLAAEEYFVGVMVSLAAATVLNNRGDLAAAGDAVDMAVASARQGGALPEVAKALFVRAEIFERLGDQRTAEASRAEAAILARDCGAAGLGRRVPARARQRTRLSDAERSAESEGTEQLTQKELEVLRLLATRLSRREIGEQLYVSLNTVKTHQRRVYRKLGVEDRDAAVTRARELGLV
jgi:LuxR family transcriptional regulator, maltose regulon positive regulatory protein